MAVKTDTEVIIGGRVLTLSGYESEEYLQKVASYINNTTGWKAFAVSRRISRTF